MRSVDDLYTCHALYAQTLWQLDRKTDGYVAGLPGTALALVEITGVLPVGMPLILSGVPAY